MTIKTVAPPSQGEVERVRKSLATIAPHMVDLVTAALWKNPAYALIAGGQLRLMRTGMKADAAWKMSKDCLTMFLKDEKCDFGDPRYSWDDQAGASLVEAYEIDHWEADPVSPC